MTRTHRHSRVRVRRKSAKRFVTLADRRREQRQRAGVQARWKRKKYREEREEFHRQLNHYYLGYRSSAPSPAAMCRWL